MTTDYNEGHVYGLHRAAAWLRMFDQDLPDFDRRTCRQLATGMAAMAAAAADRLGVTTEPTEQPQERSDGGQGLVEACRAANGESAR